MYPQKKRNQPSLSSWRLSPHTYPLHPRPQPYLCTWEQQQDEQQQHAPRKDEIGKPARGTSVPFKSMVGGAGDSPEEGRAEMQTRLREQAKRYNDLRVAYKSLCRRLDKYRNLGGSRATKMCGGGSEKNLIAKLSSRYGRESGAHLFAAGRETPEKQNPGNRRAEPVGNVARRRFPEV